MNSLLAFTIAAHGGLEQWRSFTEISARPDVGGLTWLRKGQPDLLKDLRVTAGIQQEFVSYYPAAKDWHTSFEPQRIAVESQDGKVIDELLNPRQSFAAHERTTPWTRLQAFYFASYAIWTYLNAPFAFAGAGYKAEEIAPWVENGEQWRRLQVSFPPSVATHNPVQIFYIDKTGLIRRHDYTVEISGNANSAHYLFDYVEVQGIKLATKRLVYARQDDNTPLLPEPVFVSINLTELALR
jgi:hypothetical protein